jgi:hypothetical protein
VTTDELAGLASGIILPWLFLAAAFGAAPPFAEVWAIIGGASFGWSISGARR